MTRASPPPRNHAFPNARRHFAAAAVAAVAVAVAADGDQANTSEAKGRSRISTVAAVVAFFFFVVVVVSVFALSLDASVEDGGDSPLCVCMSAFPARFPPAEKKELSLHCHNAIVYPLNERIPPPPLPLSSSVGRKGGDGGRDGRTRGEVKVYWRFRKPPSRLCTSTGSKKT